MRRALEFDETVFEMCPFDEGIRRLDWAYGAILDHISKAKSRRYRDVVRTLETALFHVMVAAEKLRNAQHRFGEREAARQQESSD